MISISQSCGPCSNSNTPAWKASVQLLGYHDPILSGKFIGNSKNTSESTSRY